MPFEPGDANAPANSPVARARALRRRATFPERLLWGRLRASRLGFKFRRQQPFGPFIADFFCPEAKLIVEIDGFSHLNALQADRSRQAFMEREGYLVVRVTNDEVLQRLGDVCEMIVRQCRERAQQPPSP